MAGIAYGVVKGRVVDFGRHENVAGSKNHFHLILEGGGKRWRCPVNIRSNDDSMVWFHVQQPLPAHPLLSAIDNLPDGLRKLPRREPGLTLDYVREPLFDRFQMRQLPLTQPGVQNDIQDYIEALARQAQGSPGAHVYAFGEWWEGRSFPSDAQFSTDSGVHDVHMNQGNNSGHRNDDGIYQDGGLLFHIANVGWIGVFCAFNSQVWFTDAQGHRLPGFAEGPKAAAEHQPPAHPPVPTEPARPSARRRVVVIAALINPEGTVDQGHETVTLFNATADTIDLAGWAIADRQGRLDRLTGPALAANSAVTLTLTGQGALLGNNGGSIQLLDPDGAQVDVRTYSGSMVASGRIVVF